ncbi:hypothetical protein PVT71_03955 [Salipiger sp. H15]|uniref:TolC family protein n=1 Tax=Alloyangia sp. H15 TaxID=3029062 RepID=A0AAU8AHG8_9RHOB
MRGYAAAPAEPPAVPRGMALRSETGGGVLEALAQRPGAIRPGTPYAAIARAVLEGEGFHAASELRVAWLRGEAEELSWLPDLGPDLSLAALRRMSDEAQAQPQRFDTPRKQAERDLALAGIDGAALALAEEANAQVFEAISRHLDAEEARARADVYEAGYRDLAALDWPLAQAGVPAELERLRAQVSRVRDGRRAALETAGAARAELAAMGDSRLGGVEGLGGLRDLVAPSPLALMQARVEDRARLARDRRAANALLDGLDLRRSPEELAALEEAAGFDGEGSEPGDWSPPEGEPRWTQAAVAAAEREIGNTARELEALRAAHPETERRRASAAASAVQATRLFRSGLLPAGQALGPVLNALDAQETELSQRFALARAELRMAYLRGTLVPGSEL